MALKVYPLHDRVMIRRIDEEKQTHGGIIIPDTAREKPMIAEVISVGSGRKNENGQVFPLSVKVGDHVFFTPYSGTPIELEGQEYLVLPESEILGVITQ